MFNSTSINGTPSGGLSPANQLRNISVITPVRSKGYSLASDANYLSQNFNKSSQQRSAAANRLISTHIDSKSPGLASRLVQYHQKKEQQQQMFNRSHKPIVQAKYDKPGIFPIVHLSKKKLPILKPTNSMSSSLPSIPDDTYSYNKKLLEGIVYPSSSKSNANESSNEVNTKSVLDALKEISRKRIHSSDNDNENYTVGGGDSDNDGKRIRMDNFTANKFPKRYRERSPVQNEKGIHPPVIDEVTASHSSSLIQKVDSETHIRKKKNVQKSPVPKPKRKIGVSVETQTPPEPPRTAIKPQEEKLVSEKETSVKDNKEVEKPKQVIKGVPLKVFDDKPLEIMRRNRLSVLMGLPIKEKLETPKEKLMREFGETEDETVQSEKDVPKTDGEKQLVSILSTSAHKSPVKKHVTFDIENDSNSAQAPIALLSTPTTIVNPAITQTSPSLVTPIVSASLAVSGATSATIATSNDNGSKLQLPTTASTAPMFNFSASPKSSVSSFNVVATTANEVASKPIVFGSFDTSVGSNNDLKPSGESEKKIGGFKFDLNAPVATTAAFPAASANLVSSSAPMTMTFGLSSPIVTSSSTLAATSSISTSSAAGGFSFMASSSISTASPIKFPVTSTVSAPATTTSSFMMPAINFGTTASLGKALAATTSLTTTPTSNTQFTFGPMTTTSTAKENLSSMLFPGKTPSVDPKVFNLFNNSATTTSATANTTTSSTPSFGSFTAKPTAITTNSAVSAPPPAFNFEMKPTMAFGDNNSKPSTFPSAPTAASTSMFGNSAGASTPFGTAKVATATTTASSAFGSTGGFSFNLATTTTSANVPIFGMTTTTASSTFGSISTGTPVQITGSLFGEVAANPTSSTSGMTKLDNSNNVFGGNNAANQLKPSISTFSASNTNPTNIFGGIAPTSAPTPAATFSFGSNTKPAANEGASSFGAFGQGSSNNNSTFGSSSTNIFGNVATTTAATPNVAPFGTSNTVQTTSASTFGSGFGQQQQPQQSQQQTGNIFGQQTSTFGNISSPSTSTFGSNQQSSVFGFGSTAAPTAQSVASPPAATASFGGFGNAAIAQPATPAFGQSTNNNNSNSFGGGSSGGGGFGASASFGQAEANKPNQVFTFGTNKPAAQGPSSGVFSFGQSSSSTGGDQPKPAFNFSAGNSSVPSFGGGFGATPSFGATTSPFGGAVASPGAPGMFSIGSGGGSSTPRARAQRGKRRP